MGTLSGAYADYYYGAGNRYSQYSTGSSYGSSARANNTAATRSKLTQTVRDIAQGYSSDLGNVEYYLRTGDVDSALKLKASVYNDISNTLSKEYNFNVSDDQIESILDQAYASVNSESIRQTVENNTSDSFMSGIKQGIFPIGLLANNNSKAEAMAQLSGTEVSGRERAKEVVGGIIGGAGSGAAIGAAIGAFGGPIGAGAGAVIGGAYGLIKTLFFS